MQVQSCQTEHSQRVQALTVACADPGSLLESTNMGTSEATKTHSDKCTVLPWNEVCALMHTASTCPATDNSHVIDLNCKVVFSGGVQPDWFTAYIGNQPSVCFLFIIKCCACTETKGEKAKRVTCYGKALE